MLLKELPSDSGVHHQWRRFGQKAKLKEKVLDKIDEAKTDDRLSLVLDHWIRNSREKQRAWTDMVEILKAMNQCQLADDIKLKNTNEQGTLSYACRYLMNDCKLIQLNSQNSSRRPPCFL